MKYLFNGIEIPKEELKNYRPLEWKGEVITLRKLTNEEKPDIMPMLL